MLLAVHAAFFMEAKPGTLFRHPSAGMLRVLDQRIEVDQRHAWKFRDGRTAPAPLCRFIIACKPEPAGAAPSRLMLPN